MYSLKSLAAFTSIIIALFAGAASAATVSYVGSGQGTTYTITFDDNTAGQINVNVAATGVDADLLGLGFNWDGTDPTAPDDFYFVSSNTGEGITDVCVNTSECGQGLNFNGNGNDPDTIFEYIVRMGDQRTANGLFLEDFSFYIASDETLDVVLGDSFGIRAQSTDGGDGSIKLIDFTLAEVPVPAAGLMLIAGLVGLGAMRRRRAA